MPKNPESSKTRSFCVSLGLHLAALILVVWTAVNDRRGSTPERSHHVGLVISHALPDRTRYAVDEASADQDSPQTGQSSASTSSAPPATFSAPLDLDATFSAMLGRSAEQSSDNGEMGAVGVVRIPGVGSADGLGNEQLIPGGPKRGQGNGQTTTSLFGVTGTGATFVYVFDRSESMTGAALRRAKSELIKSLQTLTEQQQFQVIFYNQEPRSFAAIGGETGLVLGDKSNIERATGFIESIVAAGGTEHELALRMALRLTPDVLFFLTDAKIQSMSEPAMEDLSRRAETSGTVIHGIQFGSGPSSGNTFVRELAHRNGGRYQYLDVTSLR